MGEVAEMMLDGTLCQFCGVYLDGGADGYPRSCGCENEPTYSPPVSTKIPCPICGKKCKNANGVKAHMRAKHSPEVLAKHGYSEE